MSLARMELAAVLAGLLLLSGCGTGGTTVADDEAPASSESSPSATSPSPSATSPSPSAKPEPGADAPDCKDVWKQGARLPRTYKGCNERQDGASTFVRRQVLDCSSGQRMVVHADHYYGVLGGTIHRTESRLLKDRGYGEAVARCRG